MDATVIGVKKSLGSTLNIGNKIINDLERGSIRLLEKLSSISTEASVEVGVAILSGREQSGEGLLITFVHRT